MTRFYAFWAINGALEAKRLLRPLAQFQGVRNFADAPDAPAQTQVAAWHFRPFRLPHAVSFIELLIV